MTTSENLFIFLTLFILLILVFVVKKIPWEKIGFTSKPLYKGWLPIFLFSFGIFILVQMFINFLKFPVWITDKDPLIPLLVIVFLQELIFRSFLITWLERWGKQKALWISTIVFVLFHLVSPYTWSSIGLIFAGLTFFGGYFWAWHFLKYRNIYLLTISHLIVNLSFNYVFFDFLF
ncbi:MAG: CPBP family intramembrane glutamic endopeptidase [Candidatus Paceibacterota bacterium]|jgi:membrane protease YdiL (CAAX protease family)